MKLRSPDRRRADWSETMIPEPHDPWRHFLRSERSGSSSAADEALRELFRALPQRSPGAGFVARVMARVARPSWSESRWARWTVAASLAAAALAAGLLLPALLPLARLVAPGELLSLWIRAVADLSAQFGESLGVWQQWMRAGGSVARALARPEIALMLAANAGLAWFALRRLAALVAGRSGSHVAIPI